VKTFTAAVALLAWIIAQPPVYRWEPQKSGVSGQLRGVSAVSDRVAWASGAGGTVIRTEDSGATWTKLTVPDSARLDFRDVDAIDASTAYILSIGKGTQSRIYKTTTAGATWTLQFTNQEEEGFFDAMAFWDARRGVVMGDSIGGRFDILRTEDGGRTWARIDAKKLPPALPNEGAFAGSGTNVAVLAGGHAWIGTGAGPRCRVLHTKDFGATWTVVDTPVAASQSSGIFSIAFRDARHGLVVGGDYNNERAAVDNAAATSDGGATWTAVKGLAGFRSVVAPVPGTTGSWLAVGPSGADVTIDDGKTWTAVSGDGYHAFSFAPKGKSGWGVGQAGRVGRLLW
jgi:photosystem II stability/assembly factor-like uncharacterized protein